MKQKLMIVGGVALVAAVLTTAFFYQMLSGQIAETHPEGAQTVVVASEDLARGTKLSEALLSLEERPLGTVPDDVFTSREELIGRYIINSVSAGRPLTRRLLPRPGVNGLAAAIPSGMRAVTVFVEEYAGVYDIVRAGDHVDVLSALGSKNQRRGGADVKTILQDVEVLATDREKAAQDRRISPNVTILVEEKNVERLSLADQGSIIRLALRNPTEGDQVSDSDAAETAENRPPDVP